MRSITLSKLSEGEAAAFNSRALILVIFSVEMKYDFGRASGEAPPEECKTGEPGAADGRSSNTGGIDSINNCH